MAFKWGLAGAATGLFFSAMVLVFSNTLVALVCAVLFVGLSILLKDCKGR